MSVTGEIKNLYSDKDKTRVLLPRTKTKAVSDENGTSLDVLLNEYRDYTKKVGNPQNLLDNSDFRNPVNQRGQQVYTGFNYTIDRWLLSGNAGEQNTLWIDNGYIGLSGGSTSERVWLVQRVLQSVIPIGNKATFVVMRNGVANPYILNIDSWGSDKGADFPDGVTLLYQNGELIILNGTGIPMGIVWASLYEGEYTAETLPEYQPKGYGAELAECQRYYYRIDNNNEPCWLIAVDSSFAVGAINFPVTMRLAPSLTILKCLDLSSNEVSIYNTVHTRKGISYLYGSFQVGAGYRLLFEASADL